MTVEDVVARFGSGLPEWSPIAVGVALLAGVVACAVCPCTVPVGLGVASVVGSAETQARKSGFAIALAFFVGIVLNLTMLGAFAGALGAILTESFGRLWTLAMAVLSFGAAIVAFRGPRLDVEKLEALRRPGLIGAFAYGFVFSLGTSAAPLLVLLAIAAGQASTLYGLLLALAFGIGRGLPFLMIGVFAGALMRLGRLSLWRRPIQLFSGCALVLVSLYYARAFASLL